VPRGTRRLFRFARRNGSICVSWALLDMGSNLPNILLGFSRRRPVLVQTVILLEELVLLCFRTQIAAMDAPLHMEMSSDGRGATLKVRRERRPAAPPFRAKTTGRTGPPGIRPAWPSP
jgi:hypothetical protein